MSKMSKLNLFMVVMGFNSVSFVVAILLGMAMNGIAGSIICAFIDLLAVTCMALGYRAIEKNKALPNV